MNCFFLSYSNLPSNSNNSTEFDDPTLIQNIEKNHVSVSEAYLIFLYLKENLFRPKNDWRLLLKTMSTLFVRMCSAYITSNL